MDAWPVKFGANANLLESPTNRLVLNPEAI